MTVLTIVKLSKEQDTVLQHLLMSFSQCIWHQTKCLQYNFIAFILRLKELILKERDVKTRLQADVQQLKGETERLTNELNQARNKEAEYQKAMQALEETLSKMETQRLQQRTIEVSIFHEVFFMSK